MIQPGQRLTMERAGTQLVVDRRLGQGGQGVVHLVRMRDKEFAVKWFYPGPRLADIRAVIADLAARGKPPHPAFVWPIDLVGSAGLPGFGYLMRLVEPRFVPIPQVLNAVDGASIPSFRGYAAIAREIIESFAALHAAGLCYRDISFGNLWVDPARAEIVIMDNDNVGTDGAKPMVKGTGTFMAPEVIRDEAYPSTVTDLYSQAVVLFFLFMHGHPLQGIRSDSSYTWDGSGRLSDEQLLVQNYGTHPLFIFDPNDRSNCAIPGDPTLTWWPIYPEFLHTTFLQSFTTGLRDASLQGRVTGGTWRRVVQRLHDAVMICPRCNAEVFHDREHPGRLCWGCHQPLPVPPCLDLPAGPLVLAEAATITSHHLHRDREHSKPVGQVEAYPGQPGRLVLRNVSTFTWTVRPAGEGVKSVEPGQRVGVRPMMMQFHAPEGPRQATLLDWPGAPHGA
jgi:DNA-binding helix-hairpin-helix protein with protein kinase domain